MYASIKKVSKLGEIGDSIHKAQHSIVHLYEAAQHSVMHMIQGSTI
jgi:hypothetical protein